MRKEQYLDYISSVAIKEIEDTEDFNDYRLQDIKDNLAKCIKLLSKSPKKLEQVLRSLA